MYLPPPTSTAARAARPRPPGSDCRGSSVATPLRPRGLGATIMGLVAGFDFDFTYAPEYHRYVESCIRAAKTRAHQLGCRWRTARLRNQSGRRCIVDGQTRRLDLLGRALELDMPAVCEGVDGRLAPSRARKLGIGFANLYLVGRDVNLGERPQVLKPKSDATLYFPLYEVSSDRASGGLVARLRVTEDVITDYGLGRFPDAVLLEELHTALEQVLREALPEAPRGAKWPDLLARAQSRQLIHDAVERWAGTEEHAHNDVGLLRELTRRRNAAKHRAYDPDDPWLAEHWECSCLLLERLVSRI